MVGLYHSNTGRTRDQANIQEISPLHALITARIFNHISFLGKIASAPSSTVGTPEGELPSLCAGIHENGMPEEFVNVRTFVLLQPWNDQHESVFTRTLSDDG